MEVMKIGAPALARGIGYQIWMAITKSATSAAANQPRMGEVMLAEVNERGVAAAKSGRGILV